MKNNKMMSYYYSEKDIEKDLINSKQKKVSYKYFMSLFLLMLSFFPVISSFAYSGTSAQADVSRTVLCEIIGTDETKSVYEFTSTDKWKFQLFSKSTINFGTENVDSGYNSFLSIFGKDFNRTNSEILGTALSKDSILDSNGQVAEYSYNGGSKVNPFDRFGFNGLNFTSYMGEWKYIAIKDACAAEPETVDPEANKYYEGRQEPRTTWDNIDNSKDIRTKQYTIGFGQFYIMSLGNMVNNVMFSITKFFVAVTITLVKFSFVDLSEVLGLTSAIYGDDASGDKGLYKQLHEDVFLPLAGIIFVFAGVWLVIDFVRASKNSGSMTSGLKSIMRSIAIFLIAVMIYALPSSFLQLPNSIASFGQALIVSTLNPQIDNKSSMCSTDVANSNSSSILGDRIVKDKNELEKFSENVSSAVSCIYWETFLFKPWTQAQFGTSWEKLFAEGKDIPEWAPKNSSTLGNKENSEIVGDAAVPLGNGEFVYNWALFALSVNTNAHSSIGEEGNLSSYPSGVANDWWRIVDATSNFYQEETTVKLSDATSVSTGGQTGSQAGEGWDGYGNAADTKGEGDKPLPTKWVKPAEGTNISPYGQVRYLPDGSTDIHTGIDLSSQCDRAVVSPADGVVAWVGHEGLGGLAVLVQHGGGVTSFFVHLTEGSVKVNPGDSVTAGQELATVGLTGKTFGCHLHFEIREKSPKGAWYDFKSTVDPDAFLSSKGVDMSNPSSGGSGGSSSGSNSSSNYSSMKNSAKEVTVAKIIDTEPTPYWDSWTGSSPMNRMGTVASSVIVAIFSLIPTAVPAFMAAIYSIATSFMMLFLPIVMLLGIGTDSMFAAFLGYLSSLVKIIMKRWVASVILSFAIIFTSLAMSVFDEFGWWQGVLSLIITSIVLISFRKKIYRMINAFSFAGSSALSGGIDTMASRLGGVTKAAGNISTAGLAGGITAKKYGGSFIEGIGRGAANEIRNQSYKSAIGRDVLRTYDSVSAQHKGAHASEMSEALLMCNNCGQKLDNFGIQIYARDEYGFFYCNDCMSDGRIPASAQEVTIDFDMEDMSDIQEKREIKNIKTSFNSFIPSVEKGKAPVKRMSEIKTASLNMNLSDEVIENQLSNEVIKSLASDMAKVMKEKAKGNTNISVEIPKELELILDKDLMDKAWKDDSGYSYLESAYALAWANWIEQESGRVLDKESIARKVTLGVEAKRQINEDNFRREKASGVNI